VDNLAVGEDACVCVCERQNLLKKKENNDETPMKTKCLYMYMGLTFGLGP
jgi:hypothetical protein